MKEKRAVKDAIVLLQIRDTAERHGPGRGIPGLRSRPSRMESRGVYEANDEIAPISQYANFPANASILHDKKCPSILI